MSFAELTGNARVKRILTGYLRQRRIPGSLIFHGYEAADKIGFALTFAKALNCLEAQFDSCDHCRNCQAIDKGNFLDVQVLSPEGQFYRKTQIDELIDRARQRPASSENKVYILTEAQRMNENSANAFLKTLEEPAAPLVLILLTNNLRLILPTIQSRCQLVKFYPLTPTEIMAEAAKRGCPPELIREFPYLVRQMDMQNAKIDWADLLQRRNAALEMLNSLLRQSAVEDILVDFYDRSRNRETFLTYFQDLLHLLSLLLRDIMILLVDPQSDKLIHADIRDKLMDMLAYVNSERIFFLLRKMEMLWRDMQRNLNTRILILEFIGSFLNREEEHG
jgi:DNA polymerase-3 subunit delta'